MSRAAPFCYRLAPLLRRDTWARDQLAHAFRLAAADHEQARRLLQAALARVADAQALLRAQQAVDRTIAPDTWQTLQTHLRQEYAALATRQQEVQAAAEREERASAAFAEQRQAVGVLEKHRDREAERYAAEQARRACTVADEAWLMRPRTQGTT